MKYIYIMILAYYVISEARGLYKRRSLNDTINYAEKTISRTKDFLNTTYINQNFIQGLWFVINLLKLFVSIVMFGLAVTGFKSIFG
nr:MAG TPA: hypothetical protein [Caudoviricetes sp.]